MVITETIELNGKNYIRNYSDQGFYIERDGVKYGEAIDPIGYDRIYTETDEYVCIDTYEPSKFWEVEEMAFVTAAGVLD